MSQNDDQEFRYEVGYGKPPKQTRFRKGVSGNPNGRPRGKPNWRTLLERSMYETVVINENGVRKTVTKLEAAFKQLVNKAASGDLRALQQLTPLAHLVEQAVDVPAKNLSEEDAKIFQTFLVRLPKISEPNWHIDVIVAFLEMCRIGELLRLAINVPPRSLKSHLASVCYPAWVLGHNHSASIICASYAQDLTDKLATECRTIMMTKW